MTTPRPSDRRPGRTLAAGVLALTLAPGVLALDDAPDAAPAADGAAAPAAAALPADAVTGRRVLGDTPTTLAFKNVTVEQVVPFIVEATGKVVLPQPDVLARRITILNDQPIPRSRALDLVLVALFQAGIAVVETKDVVQLRDLGEIDRQDVPVVPGDQPLADRTDEGVIVEKVFTLRNASAGNIGEIVKPNLPAFAKMTVDEESNQIAVKANVGLLKRLEALIGSLDQPNAASLATETFHLRFADATAIANNIKDLFTADGSRTNANRNQPQNPFQQFFGGGGRPGGGGNQGNPGNQGGGTRAARDGTASAATSANIRVTSNTQQNSVTVLAERQVLDQIREQIAGFWDKPLPEEAVVPRIYNLKNSDPIKVRDVLNGLFGSGTTGTQNQQGGQQGQGGGGAQPASAQGVGRLAGQFSFEALPDSNRLVVVGKSPDNLEVIDRIIADLDQPQTSGLPRIVELKHADAEELSEQLNALLSQEGTLAQIPRQETGLSESASNASPFASEQNAQNTNQQNQQPTTPGTITFWWQRARPPTNFAGASNLVAKARLVPVWRQNAVMILAPMEYQASLASLIEQLDKPGRQVLLKAVIAEISLDDATALGLRWSSQNITPTNPDNSVSLGTSRPTAANTQPGNTITGTKNDLLPGLFDTSVLNVGMDVNLLLQALSQKTAVSILSEPRIFTSDNQEAEFFSGQDIPFITNSQTTEVGSVTQSFDYRAVGISLRARPRITPRRDVDLRVNLELSSIQPNQTLFGGFIVDRRETTTQLIVRDGQTVVVSGILRTEDSDIKRKVPLLGDIPLIGLLFQSTERTKSKTELVAFITPIVVENPDETETVTEPDRQRLGELRTELENAGRNRSDRRDPAPAPQQP
jgi:type II secretion system protein D